MKPKHSILLGGVGGDSHSVGLNILKRSLSIDFDVVFLGTQNRIEEFFAYSPFVNVVLVSCMDGHAKRYLKQFPELLQQHGSSETKWYLGGNVTIGDPGNIERYFLEMGFHQVYPKFTDIKAVIESLKSTTSKLAPCRPGPNFFEKFDTPSLNPKFRMEEEKLLHSDFKERRTSVLNEWKTGKAASELSESADFLKDQPNWVDLQEQVNMGKREIIIQPRSGVALVPQQIDLFKAFRDVGATALSYQVDSLTRNNNYTEAEEEIRESHEFNMNLNGFPVVNHGVHSLRKIISETKIPLQTRHSTKKPELLAEISLAGGVTAYEGGAICYNIPYYKSYPLDEAIHRWQYVDYLVGQYFSEYGVKIDREFFGTLTATLIPPCLAISTGILESLLACSQGVKSVSVGWAEQGNRVQDIAAIRAIKKITRKYLDNLGHTDIHIGAIFHQFMAAFPNSMEKSEELIFESAITAKLAQATRILTKTPVESFKIPTLQDNIEGLYLVQKGFKKASEMGTHHLEVEIELEVKMIEKEVDEIIEAVFAAGNGKLTEGIVKAFEKGILDVPFSPSKYNRGAVATSRDSNGAIRFLSCGEIPFSKEIKDYHQNLMNERLRKEGLIFGKNDYLLIEKDVMQIARSQYERWPLYGG